MSARMTGNGSDHEVLIPDLKASELHALYAVCMRFPFVKRHFRHQALLLWSCNKTVSDIHFLFHAARR